MPALLRRHEVAASRGAAAQQDHPAANNGAPDAVDYATLAPPRLAPSERRRIAVTTPAPALVKQSTGCDPGGG